MEWRLKGAQIVIRFYWFFQGVCTLWKSLPLSSRMLIVWFGGVRGVGSIIIIACTQVVGWSKRSPSWTHMARSGPGWGFTKWARGGGLDFCDRPLIPRSPSLKNPRWRLITEWNGFFAMKPPVTAFNQASSITLGTLQDSYNMCFSLLWVYYFLSLMLQGNIVQEITNISTA